MMHHVASLRRPSLGAATIVLLLATSPHGIYANDGGAAPSPLPVADCTLVSAAEAATLLGSDVEDADATSRKGGVCSFTSRSLSTDGNVSYAIVTAADIARRRPYFALLRVRCGGVHAGTPNAGVCAGYAALAKARTARDYYAARTAGAERVKNIGDAAATTGAAVYVRSGEAVIEAAVRHEDAFDLDRSKTLARLLLERLASASSKK